MAKKLDPFRPLGTGMVREDDTLQLADEHRLGMTKSSRPKGYRSTPHARGFGQSPTTGKVTSAKRWAGQGKLPVIALVAPFDGS